MSSKRPLNSSEKSKVIGVLDYFKGHSKEGNGTCIQQTVDATGVSRATIFRLQKELKETGKLSSPERQHTRKAYKPIDDFDQTVIRNKIRQFYTHYKMLPTLRSLHAALKTEISYPGGLELLRKALKDMGYKWKKTQDNRTVLIEKPAILSLRYKFYERKHELQENGYSFVFIDETWIDTANSQKRCWQGPGLTGVQPPCNRGQRLVVVHAGSRKGFIPEAKLVYKASSSTGDYHSEIDGKQFTKWLEERLIPNLPDKCAVAMDNASYHSMQTEKCPTSSTRKDDIKVWLQRHGIAYDNDMLKPKLLDLARLNKPATSYKVDEIIRSHGHEVLRLPPYHPEFNAIELIWSQLKQIVRQKNVTFRLDDLIKITDEAFSEIGEDRWSRACDHVEKTIQEMKDSDHYTGQQMEPFIIHVTGSSDSNTDTASEGETDNSSTDTASETEMLS